MKQPPEKRGGRKGFLQSRSHTRRMQPMPSQWMCTAHCDPKFTHILFQQTPRHESLVDHLINMTSRPLRTVMTPINIDARPLKIVDQRGSLTGRGSALTFRDEPLVF